MNKLKIIGAALGLLGFAITQLGSMASEKADMEELKRSVKEDVLKELTEENQGE